MMEPLTRYFQELELPIRRDLQLYILAPVRAQGRTSHFEPVTLRPRPGVALAVLPEQLPLESTLPRMAKAPALGKIVLFATVVAWPTKNPRSGTAQQSAS